MLIIEYKIASSLQKQTNKDNKNRIKNPQNAGYSSDNNNLNLLCYSASITNDLKKNQYNEQKKFVNKF